MPPHFLVHFAVEDLAARLTQVARLGGRVQVPPFETSYGTTAVVTDNQGRPLRCCAAEAFRPRCHRVSWVNRDTRIVGGFATRGSDRKNQGTCRHGGAVVRRCTSVVHRWWRDSYGEVAGKWWIS